MASADWGKLLASVAARLTPQSVLVPFADALIAATEIDPLDNAGEAAECLPVARHWPAALSQDPIGALICETAALHPQHWRQNPNYRARPPAPGFLDNYGYLEWLGPEAIYRHDRLRFGLLLLGPHTLYPRHHHPAEEVYLPLGPGRWFKDGEGWQERVSGAVIHHPPHCGHATESGAAPLAAIYLWRGEIARAAQIA